MEYVVIAITAIFIITIVWGLLRGLMRGVGRQIVHTAAIAIAAIVSFFVTLSLSDSITGLFTTENIKGYIVSLGGESAAGIAGVADYLSSVKTISQLLVGVLIAPLIFATVFIVAKLLCSIICSILYGALNIDKPEGNVGKMVLGGAIGLLEGFIIAIIFFIPIAGITTIADDSVGALRDSGDTRYETVINGYDKYCADISEHFVIKATAFCGNPVLDGFATFDMSDHKVNLRDECVKVTGVVMEFSTLGKINYKALSEDDKASLKSALDSLKESEFLTILASDVLRGLGKAAENGVTPVTAKPPLDLLVTPMISIFATSNQENLKNDMDTILDIYFILSDSGVLSSFGEEGQENVMRDAFINKGEDGETVINKVIGKLEANEHMSPIVRAITDMSLMMLSAQFGGDTNIIETYENVKDSLGSVIAIKEEDYTPEEYREVRNEALNDAFVANGIELEADVVDEIGNYIDENFDDDELTDEEFNDIILSYYDIYEKLQAEKAGE